MQYTNGKLSDEQQAALVRLAEEIAGPDCTMSFAAFGNGAEATMVKVGGGEPRAAPNLTSLAGQHTAAIIQSLEQLGYDNPQTPEIHMVATIALQAIRDLSGYHIEEHESGIVYVAGLPWAPTQEARHAAWVKFRDELEAIPDPERDARKAAERDASSGNAEFDAMLASFTGGDK